MKVIKIFGAYVLLISLIINPIGASAYTVKNAESESTNMEQSCVDEMKSLGFTEEDIMALQEWNVKLASATTAAEIDALMDEYRVLVADTEIAERTASSIYAPDGGTLMLDYTGTINPVSSVTYLKVIYLSAAQTTFYGRAINSEVFLDFIQDQVIGAGVAKFTASIVDDIAEILSISASKLTFLVGQSVSLSLWVLDNIDKWDLDDAIDNSTTGKVKIEYYACMQSLSVPAYLEYNSCEPWNSDYISVPSDYDYRWYPGIYDYDENEHVHCFDYESYSNGSHKAECGLCGHSETQSCNFTASKYSSARHKAICDDCGYTYYENHAWNTLKTKCLVCGYSVDGPVVASTVKAKGMFALP